MRSALDSGLAASLNHLLRQRPWVRARLQAHAGKTVRLDLTPFRVQLAIGAEGSLAVAPGDAAPDVTLALMPALLPRLLLRDDAAMRQVAVTGDTALAQDISWALRNLRWDAEEDLSRVVGDIAAHRLVRAGRHFAAWPPQAAENVARAFAEYWTEERPLLAKPLPVAEYLRTVDEVRDATARLEKRIERLASHSESKTS